MRCAARCAAPRKLRSHPKGGSSSRSTSTARYASARTPQPPQIASPPVDATLTRVDYDLRVENESVAGRALLTTDVLRDGWTRVQIPAGLMVRDARLGGQPVSLVEGPPPYVLLSRAGRVVLSLDIVIPIASSAGTESIALPASPAPISRAVLALPRSGVDLSVAGGFVGEHAETPLESRWTTFDRPNPPLTLSWKRKIDDRRTFNGEVGEVAVEGVGTMELEASTKRSPFPVKRRGRRRRPRRHRHRHRT